MPKVKPLPPKSLRASLDPERIGWADSSRVAPGRSSTHHQPRAMQALELGLHIRGKGYHIYLAGEPDLGRAYFIENELKPRARKAPVPPDLVYLYNFQDPDRPSLVTLPAGRGRQLKADLSRLLTRLREEIPARFEQDAYQNRRESLFTTFKHKRDKLYSQVEDEAERKGFSLGLDDQGTVTISPMLEGRTLSPEDFEQLKPDVQKRMRHRRDEILTVLTGVLRKIQIEERGFREREQSLDREIAGAVLTDFLAPLRQAYADIAALLAYFKALEGDVLESLDHFAPRQEAGEPPREGQEPPSAEDFFERYGANLFVDNFGASGAPVITEDHPTAFNLLGCIERQSELGALYTDFSLIRAGSLHRANYGYLIIQAEDVLTSPSAWEGLLRALRSGLSRIEDPGEVEQARTKTVQPEPVPLDLKVVLIGTDETYEALLLGDDRFRRLFKIKAHMQDTVPRTAPNIKSYVQELARIIAEHELPAFEASALAGLVDFSSRLAADQTKLSLQFPLVRDLMIEAAAMAEMRIRPLVDGEILAAAQAARDFRSNLYEEEFMTDYDREIIKVPTAGAVVGRVNGLSVSFFGDYVFALPHQIACTVGVGESGIIDLEREAQLGGPIHTKAMMILKSYLLDRFAHNKPLILAGSLYFEQSYAHVEGDSASGAELAALLSALAGVPLDLSLAFTGAVNQSGAIMAVGEVTRKIEGFFEVCRRRKLTGRQGVIIPADNVVNLMLKPEVVEAVKAGTFHIYPAQTIEQAMELLSGRQAGKRRKDGSFPPGTLYRLVDERLSELSRLAKRFRSGR